MRLTIQRKVILGFTIVLFLLIIIGGLGFLTAQHVNKEFTSLIENQSEKVNLLDKMMISHAQIVGDVRGYFLYQDEKFMQTVSEHGDDLKQYTDELQSMVNQTELQSLIADIQAAREKYQALTEEAMIVHKAGDMDGFNKLAAEAAIANSAYLENAEQLKQVLETQLAEAKFDIGNLVQSSNLLNIILVASSILIGLIVTFLVDRVISRPIKETTKAIEEVAAGNLSLAPLNVKNKDEIGQMAASLNQMLTTWNGVVRRMNDAAVELAARSEELSASSEESYASSQMVAQSAAHHLENSEKQLNHVNESTEAMIELDQGIEQIGRNNDEMHSSADDMSSLIGRGILMVRDVSTSMDDIHSTIRESTRSVEVMEKKSVEIQQVTALITEISEQTNLLALNAAIEAARAGEHGKGFAIVADEVRRLAEESKVSATKIEEMIKDVHTAAEQAVHSIKSGNSKVANGLERSAQSLSIFGDIEVSVDGVNSKIDAVSSAIDQIQLKSQDVYKSSGQLKQLAEQAAAGARETSAVTQEQAAAMEMITSSTEALASLAEGLRTEVQQFNI
ncbi:methyl-accepting chemotaxis protein [Sporosarcina sp. FSL W7-1349]|uniref:methyl-accepting chemotaxis protein n=1 Tax=Sporosarcina sp. FSL W7-1349 TaxID=2921561 RepID=UPI0030F86AFE